MTPYGKAMTGRRTRRARRIRLLLPPLLCLAVIVIGLFAIVLTAVRGWI